MSKGGLGIQMGDETFIQGDVIKYEGLLKMQ